MIFRRFIARLLAIAIVAGLAVAPVAAPAAMQASMHASMAGMMADGMTDMSSMTDMPSMAADMPCCPDEQKGRTCTDCPVVAMCVMTTAQAAPPATSALPVRHAVYTTHALRDDVFADGLSRPPPDQPPRNLA